nr:MAG TPA: hypothetical protein [Caudoviricetes sp.]
MKRPFFYGNNPVPIGKLPKPQLRFAAFLSRSAVASPLCSRHRVFFISRSGFLFP